MRFKGSRLGENGQGMKDPIQPVWRPKFEGLGFSKRDRVDVASMKIS